MKTVKLKVSNGRRKGSGILALQGNLTLDCVDQILRSFREATKKYTDLEVRASNVAALDLGFLQLLHSLEEHQKGRGATLQVALRLEPDMVLLLRNTGFSRWVGDAKNHAK